MVTDFLLGLNGIQHSPSLIFCIGLLGSVTVCSLVELIESSRFGGEFSVRKNSLKRFRYQQFRNELITFPRHLGFASGEVHELEDHEFH